MPVNDEGIYSIPKDAHGALKDKNGSGLWRRILFPKK
jgi:hypothetical protein